MVTLFIIIFTVSFIGSAILTKDKRHKKKKPPRVVYVAPPAPPSNVVRVDDIRRARVEQERAAREALRRKREAVKAAEEAKKQAAAKEKAAADLDYFREAWRDLYALAERARVEYKAAAAQLEQDSALDSIGAAVNSKAAEKHIKEYRAALKRKIAAEKQLYIIESAGRRAKAIINN